MTKLGIKILFTRFISVFVVRMMGGFWCGRVKLNVVQKRWLCVLACTSFLFYEGLVFFLIFLPVFCRLVGFFTMRHNGLQLKEVAVLEH